MAERARRKGSALPTGTLTFLVSDIERSTEIWDASPEAMNAALERHDRTIAKTVAGAGGQVVKGLGDGTFAVFRRATAAVAAALDLKKAFADGELGVRLALHTGEAFERDGDYFGPTVNRLARIATLAKPGQVLASQVTVELIRDQEIPICDRGTHRLRGLSRSEHIYEIGTPRPAGDEDTGPQDDPGSRIRVMIVDDHPLWRDTIRNVIEHKGARVVSDASDGTEAVEAAERTRPDVVLMDMELPKMRGPEATKALLRACPDAKVLVLSSRDDRDGVLEAVAAGASGYLLKTADAGEIAEAVRRINEGELVFPPQLSQMVLTELRRRG